MELSVLVNEQDEIIGYKDRSKLERGDIHRVSVLMLRNSAGELLLAQRGFKKKNSPGHWSFSAAGGVEKGESYMDCIIKEAGEEIGVKDLEMKESIKMRVRECGSFFFQVFTAQMDESINYFEKEEGEVAKLRWFSPEEIQKGEYGGYPFTEALINYLETT